MMRRQGSLVLLTIFFAACTGAKNDGLSSESSSAPPTAGAPSGEAPGTPGVSPEGAAGTKKDELKLRRTLGIVLYKNFEVLDVFGPAEMFSYVGPELRTVYVAEKAGPVMSVQGIAAVAEFGFDDAPFLDLVMVPGGVGTVPELENERMLGFLQARAKEAEIVLSVCTGSALLARAGLLDGYKATSNKLFFNLARVSGPRVEWIEKARWVEDRDRVTSSGVSAGMDMSLAVIARLWGDTRATMIASSTEYVWHRDPNDDPFYVP